MTRRNGGFALLCVLWILVILSIITISFGRRAVLERRAAMYVLNHDQALSMARGAVQRGIAELRNKTVNDRLQNPRARFSYTGFDQPWHKHGSLDNEGLFKIEDAGPGDGVSYRIRDDEGLISINRAPEKILDNIAGLGVRGAGEIMDARKLSGTAKKHDPFVIPEQVLDLDGVDEDAWVGTDESPGLRDLLTCWGDGKINLNTASRAVLETIPDLDPSVLDAVITYRSGPDGELGTKDDRSFETFSDIAKKAHLSAESVAPLMQYCTLDSHFFTITGLCTLRHGKIRATCEASVQVSNGVVRIHSWREDVSGS